MVDPKEEKKKSYVHAPGTTLADYDDRGGVIRFYYGRDGNGAPFDEEINVLSSRSNSNDDSRSGTLLYDSDGGSTRSTKSTTSSQKFGREDDIYYSASSANSDDPPLDVAIKAILKTPISRTSSYRTASSGSTSSASRRSSRTEGEFDQPIFSKENCRFIAVLFAMLDSIRPMLEVLYRLRFMQMAAGK